MVKADCALNIAKMRVAIAEGLSHAGFVRRLRQEGITPLRKTVSLGFWRSEQNLEAKKDLMKYVRKDYYPAEKAIAQVTYEMSAEFLYKVRVTKRAAPDEPLTERFVNIMSDSPMTPRMIEQAVVEKWREWEKYRAELIEEITPFMAVRKTPLWGV